MFNINHTATIMCSNLYPNNLQDLEQQTKDILSQKMFPKIEIQVTSSAKFVEYFNGKEEVINRWMKSDIFVILILFLILIT